MQISKEIEKQNIAKVFIGQIGDNRIEFTESFQPPFSIDEKWIITISCLYGCPVKCLMCDAGQHYKGKLTEEDILNQIDHVVTKRFPDRRIPVKKFKIQFTRMGEPAFNDVVLDVLQKIPKRYDAPGLIPSLSTVGPRNCGNFFERLRQIKNNLYSNGKFQMQFSIHTTDIDKRNLLIPTEKMSFQEISEYGKQFFSPGDRKITLNFIVMENYPVNPEVIRKYFDPSIFLIKLTPLNPTDKAAANNLNSKLNPNDNNSVSSLVNDFQNLGFQTITSIGELGENEIGSNCGQFVSKS